MNATLWTAERFYRLLEEDVAWQGDDRNTPEMFDLQERLSRPGKSKASRAAIARAALGYFSSDYIPSRTHLEIKGKFHYFLNATRLLIFSPELREAVIKYIDIQLSSERAQRYTLLDLMRVVILEAASRRSQVYYVHEAPGSAVVKPKKRVASYKAQPWALEATLRWLPTFHQWPLSLGLCSVLMKVFEVVPEAAYSTEQLIFDVQGTASENDLSEHGLWVKAQLMELEFLKSIGRLTEGGHQGLKGLLIKSVK